jgi:hypothetical protein
MKELRTPTKKTNPIHNEAPENTTFLLLDQPSGEASTTGTPITDRNEIAINANTANWKAIVMVVIHQVKKYEISYTINPFLVIIYLLSQKYFKFFFNSKI